MNDKAGSRVVKNLGEKMALNEGVLLIPHLSPMMLMGTLSPLK